MRGLILVALLCGQALGQWTELSNTALISSGLCPAGTSGGTGCSAVIESWSGAAADTLRSRLIIWGGGHGDYNGNEVYALYAPGITPVGVACSSLLCRIKAPSASLRSVSGSCSPDEADGVTPNSRHTYDGLVYIAHRDKLFTNGGSVACGSGSHYGDTWTLDLSTLTWESKDPATLASGAVKPRDVVSGSGSPGQGPWVNAAYDPSRQLVFLQTGFFSAPAGATLWSYDEATNTYATLTTTLPMGKNASWVIDPVRHRLYMIGNGDGPGIGNATTSLGTARITYIDISEGSSYTSTTVTAPSCDGIARASNPGVDYDSALDRIVGWPNFGDTVYLFDPVTDTCTTQTFTGGPSDSRNASNAVETTGTFGRFRYFPAIDAFLLVNDGSTNAYMLQLTGASFTGTFKGTFGQ